MLYLHGGLVDQSSAETVAARLSSNGELALNAPEDWEQIYIVWRTGFSETLRTNWTDLLDNDRLYKALFKRLIAYVGEKILAGESIGRGAGAGSQLTDREIKKAITSGSDAPFRQLDDALAASSARPPFQDVSDRDIEAELGATLEKDRDLGIVTSDINTYIAEKTNDRSRAAFTGDDKAGKREFDRVSDSVKADWEAAGPSGRAQALERGGAIFSLVIHGVKIASRVFQRLRAGRDHGVHATIAEEIAAELYGDLIGSSVWEMMTNDAVEHFSKSGLGGKLLEALSSDPSTSLLVVGHSAGSIWATEFVEAGHRAGHTSPVSLLFLAPAVRVKRFASMLDKCQNRIDKFQMFVMEDELERADVLLGSGYGYVYPSSLLYLVSGLFEHDGSSRLVDAPLLGMSRFLSQSIEWVTEPDEAASLAKVREFLAAKPDRVIRSETTPGSGLQSRSRTHGGFDDDADTIASIASYML